MEWVKDRIDQMGMDYDQMIEYIKDTPAGSNGVIFSPWMHGNRCPFDDANSRGLFFNLDITTHGSDSVSYTHLDVYKRQSRCRVVFPFCSI